MARASIVFQQRGGKEVQATIRGLSGQMAIAQKNALAMSASMTAVGKRLTSVGRSLTIGLTLPILAVGAGLLKMASDAQESENLFEVAMGDMAVAARAFSEDMRRQFGLNAFEVRKTVATFQQMTSAMGLSESAAFAMSKGLTQLTFDFASFFNLRADVAFQKLQAGITGEIEPLKRLGILVNETTIKATALRHGLIGVNESMSEQTKIIARFITIAEQGKNAIGDLGATLDSPANQMRILSAQFQQATIDLGNALLPVFAAFMGLVNRAIPKLQSMVEAFRNLSPATKGMVIAGAGLLAVFGPLTTVIGGLLRVLPFLVTAFFAVLSPIGLLIGAFAALTALFVEVALNAERFAEIFGRVFQGIELVALTAIKNIVIALGAMVQSIPGFGDDMARGLGRVVDALSGTIARLQESIGTDAGAIIVGGFKQAFDQVVNDVKGAMDQVGSLFARPFEAIGEAANISREDTVATFQGLVDELIIEGKRLGDALTLENQSALTKQFEAREAHDAKVRNLEIARLEFFVEQGEVRLIDLKVRLALELLLIEENTEAELALMRKLAKVDAELAEQKKTSADKIRESQEAELQRVKESFDDVFFNTAKVLKAGNEATQRFFLNIATGAKSVGESVKGFFKEMVASILAQFAKMAANKIFQTLFGGGGKTQGESGLFGPGGGGFGGGGGGSGSFFDIFQGGALGGFLGGLGGFLGFQTGGSIVVSRPTPILVGEGGAERVTVTPSGRAGFGGGMVEINFNGDVMFDEITTDIFAERVARVIRQRGVG